MALTWRAPTREDIPALAELHRAADAVDHPDWLLSADEIAMEFDRSWLDPATDFRVAIDGDRIVAVGWVIPPKEPESLFRIIVSGTVHPAHRGRGIGTELLAWELARAREHAEGYAGDLPRWILGYADRPNAAAIELFETAGLSAARYFTSMERALAAPIPDAPAPAGVRIERYTRDRSEAARAAKNAAFLDHWGSAPSSRESWEQWQALPTARDDLSFLAVDEAGAVIGFLFTEDATVDEGTDPYPYVGLVGTVREWRGRGVAHALLAAQLRAAHTAGASKVVLDVDSENPTGALGVYERVGYRATPGGQQAHLLVVG